MRDVARLDEGPDQAGPWYQWGPYLSDRAWGTVREDYSADGDAWAYFPYDHARSRSYRWNEDGMAGLSDLRQDLCLSLALWNGRDSHLKERMFGLSNSEGNHGEDVKEVWWYRDALPSHAYLSWRYHYPQAAFPYDELLSVNQQRDRTQPEYELVDTGVFDDNRFWEVNVEYAKASTADILMRITVTNRGPQKDTLHVLPHLWFRNTWDWGRKSDVPRLWYQQRKAALGTIVAQHWRAGVYRFQAAPVDGEEAPLPLFCNNESNNERLWQTANNSRYPKDGINDHVLNNAATVDPDRKGTKSAWWYTMEIDPGETKEIRLRLYREAAEFPNHHPTTRNGFLKVLKKRREEADEFYDAVAPDDATPDEKQVMRQAFAGMIWVKQFYRYDVSLWLDGDPNEPPPPPEHKHIRNYDWRNLDAYDVISMPDAWEYPWFAAWDLAFHTVVFAHIDPTFAKYQLLLMLREWYQHPNGAIPAYEWNFDDRNPPVHAWAAIRVFEIDGAWDFEFLERVFHKLLINFTWWVNRVDRKGNNVFEGGFLGLDNIGPIDRSNVPHGARLEQADGTSWMAFYCLTMLRITLRLSEHDGVYSDMALKFLEHFASITDGMSRVDMWDPQDGFFYDQLVMPDGSRIPLKVRSVVGLIPVLAAAYIPGIGHLEHAQKLRRRFFKFMSKRDVADADMGRSGFVSTQWDATDQTWRILLTVVDPDRLRRVLADMLDEKSILSPFGLRSLSKIHEADPFSVTIAGEEYSINYEPAESETYMYGGNSNWRGPVWFPINHLVIESLERYHMYLGDDFTVECPTGSGNEMTLKQVAEELRQRLVSLFLPGKDGVRPADRSYPILDSSTWHSNVTFYEYFNGDNGAGLGASHQTGWTGLVADLIIGRRG
ncbi:MAG: glucosidase [Actinobacteria bacterium]|nr:glucosidase [Actinomycetota bacterium]